MSQISFVLPCRNEKESLRKIIREIKKECQKQKIDYEIIVSDSSSDGSDLIARQEKVILVKHDLKGYGMAIKKGIEKASFETIIYGDPDRSYNFSEFPKLLREFNKENIILGNRLRGEIEKKQCLFLIAF